MIPTPVRWNVAQTLERVEAQTRLACEQWWAGWVGGPAEILVEVLPFAFDTSFSNFVLRPEATTATLAFSGLRKSVAQVLSLSDVDEEPVQTQVLGAASSALRQRLAERMLTDLTDAQRVHTDHGSFDSQGAKYDGSLLLSIVMGRQSFLLAIDGATVATHAAPRSLPASLLPEVSIACFEHPSHRQRVSLEFVIGEAQVSLEALQRAEIDDVIVLDAAIGAPFTLRAPSLGSAWSAYLAQHEGRLVAETSHDG